MGSCLSRTTSHLYDDDCDVLALDPHSSSSDSDSPHMTVSRDILGRVVLNGYLLLDTLGQGAFGLVKRARHCKSGQLVVSQVIVVVIVIVIG
jgi:hypothetical protein